MYSQNIIINNLSFNYDVNTILKNINLTIPRGGFSLIIGPNGCGKSTLLRLIAGLYPQYGGRILKGNIINPFKNWGMIFQEPDKQFTMATPRQEFIFTLENIHCPQEKAYTQINNAVKLTKIEELLDRPFIKLSGGEKQRVALAIIMAMDPPLILLDEPFACCDMTTRHLLIKQLALLKQAGKTILITDHNLAGYQNICDDIFGFINEKFVNYDNEQKRALFAQVKLTLNKHFEMVTSSSNADFSLKKFTLKNPAKFLINQVTIDIPKGKGILLTGENGSGKTSLFKAMTKLIDYEGNLFFEHKEIKKWSFRKYLSKVNQAFQNADDQFLMITVQEELELSQFKCANSLFDEQMLQHYLSILKLNDHLQQTVYSLSGGQKKRLQLLLMIMANPQVLLLDEPFTGLDCESITIFINLLKEYFIDKNKTVIIISHNLDQMDQLCQYHLQLQNQNLKFITN